MEREIQIGDLNRSSLVTIEELIRLCSVVLGVGSKIRVVITGGDKPMVDQDDCTCTFKIDIQGLSI